MKLPPRSTINVAAMSVVCLICVGMAISAVWNYEKGHAENKQYYQTLEEDRGSLEARKQSVAVTQSDEYLANVSPEVARFLRMLPKDSSGTSEEELASLARSLSELRRDWKPTYTVMLLEIAMQYRVYDRLMIPFLAEMTGQKLGYNQMSLLPWIWKEIPDVHPDYLEFKAQLYSHVDKEFVHYFQGRPDTRIRSDEIVWGGVMLEQIPRLSHPLAMPAREAIWMGDDDIVFGLKINGESRAYPRRIYAYHELIQDRLGGVEIVTPYCTMCESVNVYEAELNGGKHDLRTSGFIYRSNKLMYDVATHSMWSSVSGEPVVGSLVKQKLKLKRHPVQTATWKKWREAHPDTTVISINTGFSRDYNEGVAYSDYHRTPLLWFPVPAPDARLPEKHLVLAIPSADSQRLPVAIDRDFLQDHPVYVAKHGDSFSLVLTDRKSGCRVYAIPPLDFAEPITDQTISDTTGRKWSISDETLASPGAENCLRIPAHEIYWLPWVSHNPETLLLPE